MANTSFASRFANEDSDKLSGKDVAAAYDLLREEASTFYCDFYTPQHALLNIYDYFLEEGIKHAPNTVARGCSAKTLGLSPEVRPKHEKCLPILRALGLIAPAQVRMIPDATGSATKQGRAYNSVPTPLGECVALMLADDGLRSTAVITPHRKPVGLAVKGAKKNLPPAVNNHGLVTRNDPSTMVDFQNKVDAVKARLDKVDDAVARIETILQSINALQSRPPQPIDALFDRPPIDIVAETEAVESTPTAADPPKPVVVNAAELISAVVTAVVDTLVQVCDNCTTTGGSSEEFTAIGVRELYCALSEVNKITSGVKSFLIDRLSAGHTTVPVDELQAYRDEFVRFKERIKTTPDGVVRGPILLMSDAPAAPGLGRFQIRTLTYPVWRKKKKC